MKTEKVKRFLE